MYNYYEDTIWMANAVLLCVVILTCLVIFLTVAVKNYFSERRSRGLLRIKNDLYEFALSHKSGSSAVRPPSIDNVTPQQFIDIKTNRRIGSVFFNDSEQEFLKTCFVGPEELAKLEATALRSGNKWRKIEAILCLGYMQSGSAVDILKKTLLSRDKDLSYFSIISLSKIGTVDASRALLELLKKEPSISYKIVSVLETFPKDIASDVFKLLDYHDPLVRYWALKLLSKFVSHDHVSKLIKLTDDMSPDIRAAACDCLGNAGSGESVHALTKCLKDENWLVRSRAVYAAGKVMARAAISEVAPLINDPSWVVLNAVRAVMAEEIEASLPYIEKFLAGDYELAKKYSVLALQDSGQIDKLLKEALSGHDRSIKLLKGVIRSKFHSGLDAALGSLEPEAHERALGILMKAPEA